MPKFLPYFLLSALLLSPIYGQKVRLNYIILDQIGGKKVKTPVWAEKNLPMSALEDMHPGKYAFVVRKDGPDLAFLESWVNKVQVGGLVARQISQNISEIVSAEERGGSSDAFRQTMTALSENISRVRLSGLRREQEWWIYKEFKDKERKGQKEYSYSALFLIEKLVVDRLIAAELEKILLAPEARPEVQAALSKMPVRELDKDAADFN